MTGGAWGEVTLRDDQLSVEVAGGMLELGNVWLGVRVLDAPTDPIRAGEIWSASLEG